MIKERRAMRPFNISTRLKTIASYIPKGSFFADIGTDHAYLPCYVCLKDANARVIAGEVNKGPYESALQTVDKYGLNDVIDVRLGDGLDIITAEEKIRQLVIAGMGGSLITKILDQGTFQLSSVERMIVQPNIDSRQVRRWMFNHQYAIVDEIIIEENNHIYEIIVADHGKPHPYDEDMQEQQLLFGPFLMQKKSQLFYKKWSREKQKLTKIINQMAQAKQENNQLRQFKQELQWIKEVL